MQDSQEVWGGDRIPEEQPENLERAQRAERAALAGRQEQHQPPARDLHQRRWGR